MIPSDRTEGYVDTGKGPSHRELWKKITAAIALIQAGDWIAGNAGHLHGNFRELEEKFGVETTTEEDRTEIIVKCLRELHPRYYSGDCPPEKSFELAVAGQAMFIFKWKSAFFKNTVMYIKFGLIGTGEKGPACVHSIHPNRPY
jgi:hypothetical protein